MTFISIALMLGVIIICAVYAINKLCNYYEKMVYQCSKCKNVFKLDLMTSFISLKSMEIMGAKLVICPRCGNKIWAVPIGTDDSDEE